jgi:tetratricopeptide (TPR) repeat protein
VPSEPTGPVSLADRALGPYRLRSLIGSGGMGAVYLATVEGRVPGLEPGARVAVKVVHAHLLAREGFFRRFLREAEIGRRLRHENVVRTLDADVAGEGAERVHFFVLEYVEGQTLRALTEELERVPEELCRHVGREVAKALDAIHGAGAVHRDLKPDNVLVTREHAVKVMDLGVARLRDEAVGVSETGTFVGSVRYAAPEQFRGGPGAVDGRADLYALGLTLYEMATGRHPFPDEDLHAVLRRQLGETPRPAGELNSQLSPFFEEVLRRLLEKDPAARFPDAASLRQVLEEGERSAWWQERAKAIRRGPARAVRAIRVPRETAVVGREPALAELRRHYDAARAGEGRVVLVQGEAGIGKSRLVDEFVARLRGKGEEVAFLYGAHPPGGAATASGALVSAFREHLGVEGLEESLRPLLTSTPALVPAFAALLRGEGPPAGAQALGPDALPTCFVYATRALAAERTAVVLVDDLHFAPADGRSLFTSLALAVPGHRILLIGTTRPTSDERWLVDLERAAHPARLVVERLGPKDLVVLLRDALRSESLAEALSAKVAVKSDGNPYFVFEILRALREGRLLAQGPDGTWASTQEIRDLRIPSSVLELVQARVAELEEEDRNLLDVAACLGFEFDPLVVGDVLGVPPVPLLRRLARIERAHRLVRAVGTRYVFDHHQVQEALHGSLSPLLRAEYHAALADALEARARAQGREPDGPLRVDLAEHFLEGGRLARALPHLDAALTHLEGSDRHEAAARLAGLALADPSHVTGADRVRLLLRAAESVRVLGFADRWRALLGEALAGARAGGDAALRATAAVRWGGHLLEVSGPAAARGAFEEALAEARASGDARVEGRVLVGLGSLCEVAGEVEAARAHHERALALFGGAGDAASVARVLGNLGVTCVSEGRLAEARDLFERSRALAREVGDRRAEMNAEGNLGRALGELGLFEEARACLDRLIAHDREIGYRHGEAVGSANLSGLCFMLGRYAEALAHRRRALALCREIGYRKGEAIALGNLGSIFADLGLVAEARDHAERALALSRDVGHRYGEGYWLHLLADLARETDDVPGAERLFSACLDLRRAIRHEDGVSETLLAWGATLAQDGRADAARPHFEEGLALARRLGRSEDVVLATAHLAATPEEVRAAEALLEEEEPRLGHSVRMHAHLLLARLGAGGRHLEEARRLLDDLVAHAPPEHRATMVANVRLHREIAAATGA